MSADVLPLARLKAEPGVQDVDAAARDEVNAGTRVLFFTGLAKGRKEAQDVAIVLLEMLKANRRIAIDVVADTAEDALRQRYGVRVLPALVFLKDGIVMRALFGFQDWAVYTAAFATHFGAP